MPSWSWRVALDCYWAGARGSHVTDSPRYLWSVLPRQPGHSNAAIVTTVSACPAFRGTPWRIGPGARPVAAGNLRASSNPKPPCDDNCGEEWWTWQVLAPICWQQASFEYKLSAVSACLRPPHRPVQPWQLKRIRDGRRGSLGRSRCLWLFKLYLREGGHTHRTMATWPSVSRG
jgi:hypothetical protein